MNSEALSRLVGTWSIEATHPGLPGVVVHGEVVIEWLEGEKFLIHRARLDHPDFPDSLSIIGRTDQDRVDQPGNSDSNFSMHYFDSRGVFRVYEVAISNTDWRIWRDAPGFSQRFTGTFSPDGETIAGQWQLREDAQWNDDLRITYRRGHSP